MKAMIVSEPGGPEVLSMAERPTPDPGYGQVRVRVELAGVNRADLLQRMGRYPAPHGAPPDILGLEYFGRVDAIGEGVTSVEPGQRVAGIVGGGAYAEYVLVHEGEVAVVPDEVSDEAAAAVPEAFVTAYDALTVRARLKPGETVLVHAVGSGVGTAAVQIARALGCRVIGTSRTESKLERAKELGLDIGVLATSPDAWVDGVREATGGRGPDVVIELVGGDYVSSDVQACAKGGRIALVGLTAGISCQLSLAHVLTKRIEIVGTVLRSRPLEQKIEAADLLRQTLMPWLARGMIKPVVDSRMSLGDAAEAHRRLAANETFGKVLLQVA